MVDSTDWAAAMDSEIFRNYASAELAKMKVEASPDEDNSEVLEQFEQFELDVRSSPQKLAVFRALQNKFATDPDYTSTVKTSFVNAVMMLNLD